MGHLANDGFLRRMAQQAAQVTGAGSSEIILLRGDSASVISSDSPVTHTVAWSGSLVANLLDAPGFVARPSLSADAARLAPFNPEERLSSFAGVSLCRTDGSLLGALAVYYPPPTDISPAVRESLSGFGRMIEVWVQELVSPRTELPSWARSGERGLPLLRCTLTLDGTVLEVGPFWEKVTGLPATEAIGRSFPDLLLDASKATAETLLNQAFGGGGAAAPTLVFAGAPPRTVSSVVAQLLFTDGVPEQLFLTGWSEGQAIRPSHASPRSAFEQLLYPNIRRAVQSATLLPVALLDIDGFSRVNESLGFACGDRVLETVISRLSAFLPNPPAITRIGGDEIALMLPSCCTPAEAERHARYVLHALDEPLRIEGHELELTANLGLVLAPIHAVDPDLLLRFAETALRCVKSHGHNHVAVFDPRWLAARSEARRLETDLARALRQREFRLQFQPQVRFDGSLAGLEALVEWVHPDLGVLGPSRFIPIAEEVGRIGELGEWVLRAAAGCAADWRRRGIFPHRLAVNVSPIQFGQPGFSRLVATILQDAGLPGSSLELELTESALLPDLKEAHRRMDAIRALGVSLCLDDFGVGYSSLHHLQSLPLDAVKIDRSFVARIAHDPGSLDLIHTIANLARNRGLRIVAEGVETAEQARYLAASQCDLAQGFWISRPASAAQVEEWLTSGHRWPAVAGGGSGDSPPPATSVPKTNTPFLS